MNKLKFLLKDTFIYGGTIAFNALIMLLTIPLLTNNFSVEDYGLIDLYITLVTVLVIFFVFGQDSAVARFFYEFKSMRKKKKIISESFYFQMLFVSIFLPIFYFIVIYFFENINHELILLVFLQVPFFIILNFSQNLLKWTFQRNKFILLSLGSTLLIFVLLLLVINFFHLEVKDIFLIYLISRFFFSLLGLYFVRKWLVKIINFKSLKFMIPYSIPFGVISLITLGLPFFERIVFLNFLTPYELGLYAVALKIVFFISLPIQAFQIAWGPFLYSNYKDRNNYDLFNFIFKFFAIVILLILMFILFFSNYIVLILSSVEYIESTKIIFALCMSTIILSIGNITEVGIDLSKKSHLKLYGFFASLIIGMSCTYFFIKEYGFYYSGWGILVGNIFKVVIDTYLARIVYELRWDYTYLFLVVILIIFLETLNIYVYNYQYDFYISLFILCFLLIYVILLLKKNSSILILKKTIERT